MEKKSTEQISSDSTVRELQELVDYLPRTDHMTLPAIQVAKIDEETRERMESITMINNATKPNEVINEEGKTLQQVRTEFEFGVTNFNDEALKHKLTVSKDSEGNEKLTIQGAHDKKEDAVVIKATLANIAPVDADAPTNPVDAKKESNSNPDIGKSAIGDPVKGTPVMPEVPEGSPSPSTASTGTAGGVAISSNPSGEGGSSPQGTNSASSPSGTGATGSGSGSGSGSAGPT